MPLLNDLRESSALRIVRFADVDQFRAIEGLGRARSIPTKPEQFVAGFASVELPGSTIFLQRTFPRILEINHLTSGVIIGFPMEDRIGMRFNGVEVRDSFALLIRGSARVDFVETRSNLFGIASFSLPMHRRGWPNIKSGARLVDASPEALHRLQRTVREIMLLASTSAGDFLAPGVGPALETSLIAVLDDALRGAELVARQSAASSYLALVRRLDDLLVQNPSSTLYTGDLATALGVSARTLHNAVVAIRGCSLHGYIRLRRLWSTRKLLLKGGPRLVKDAALANGFWHLGEFSALYRKQFGETPTETLERGRPR